MAKEKVDLTNLKKEIESRKKSSGLAEGTTATPKDEFLNGLLTSLNSGRRTNSTELIKLVENKTAEKQGEQAVHVVKEDVEPPAGNAPTVNMNPTDTNRDEQFYRDMNKMGNKTLADSIENFKHRSAGGAPPTMGGTQTMGATPTAQPLNEDYLIAGVQKLVDSYLVENFAPIVEEAIKSTILELYAVERIKDVLKENKEIIKTIVYETIREIQAKSKKK